MSKEQNGQSAIEIETNIPKPLQGTCYRVLRGIPEAHRLLFLRVMGKTASPRQMIKAKCQDCVGHEDSKNRIRNCQSAHCPLWHERPYQTQEDDITEE